MKRLIQIVFFAVIAGVAVGYYFKNTGDPMGDKIIGISVLGFSFVLLPLFIYHRYSKKDLSKYNLFPHKDDEETEKD